MIADTGQCPGLDCDRPYRHAPRMQEPGATVQESLKRDPHAGDLYVFRGRRGDLIKIFWHDGLGHVALRQLRTFILRLFQLQLRVLARLPS